jgi:hypothetical protein
MDRPTRDVLVVNSIVEPQLPPINLGAQTPDTLQIWTDWWHAICLLLLEEKNTASFLSENYFTDNRGDGTILNNVNQVFTLRTPRSTVLLLVSCP